MNIEWWMLDGLIGLIVLIAVIRGMVKGIGDALFRLIGLGGGLALGVFYSDRVSEYLRGTRIKTVLYDHIFGLLSPAAAEQAEETGSDVVQMVSPQASDTVSESLPKTLGGLVSGLANKTADVAADRLTEICISILSFVVIVLAIWLVMAVIKGIYKSLRKNSFVLGFVDRLLGMVLGIIRGMIVSFIVIAALIPVTTIFAPDKVPEILEAMKFTHVAGIIYDINPLMLLVKYVIG